MLKAQSLQHVWCGVKAQQAVASLGFGSDVALALSVPTPFP